MRHYGGRRLIAGRAGNAVACSRTET